MRKLTAPTCLALVLFLIVPQAHSALKAIAKDPYIGAIAIDADSGQVIIEDHADALAYPASVVKMMNLMVILDKIQAGELHYTDVVTVSRDASSVGGSQVWLKENETFTVEDLIYAMMVPSANDAAMALALHVAGSKEMFVELMNQKAKALDLKSTIFRSVHGLPPSSKKTPPELPDITTPRDIATLSRAILLQHPEALRFTSTQSRIFRPGPHQVNMHNHNPLLGQIPGCDGFKTGWYDKAGFSISATVKTNDHRVIVVVMGSPTKQSRNAATRALILKALHLLPSIKAPPPPPPPVSTNAVAVKTLPPPPPATTTHRPIPRWTYAVAGVVALGLIWGIGRMTQRRPKVRDF